MKLDIDSDGLVQKIRKSYRTYIYVDTQGMVMPHKFDEDRDNRKSSEKSSAFFSDEK